MSQILRRGTWTGMLAALAIATSALTGACDTDTTDDDAVDFVDDVSPTEPSTGLDVRLTEFQLTPSAFNLQSGTYAFNVVNAGTMPHGLRIEGPNGFVAELTRLLNPGESATLRAGLAAGNYVMFCPAPGHRALGMTGTITVSTPPAPPPTRAPGQKRTPTDT